MEAGRTEIERDKSKVELGSRLSVCASWGLNYYKRTISRMIRLRERKGEV